METLRVLRTAEEVLAATLASHPSTTLQLLALYDSRLDAVITHPGFMSLHISDALNHGFGVFDTAIAYESRIYQLDRHLERLVKSATFAKIVPPLAIDVMTKKVQQLLDIVRTNCRVRLFVSGGFLSPDFSYRCPFAVFYALAYNDIGQSKPSVVREATVSIPCKPNFLSIIKSNNYTVNALCVLEAREKGGYMGIQVSEEGYILESAIANVCAVLSGGHLRTPPADRVLDGTTVRRLLELAKELVADGTLQSADRGLFTVADAQSGQELMLVGGDGLVGISHLDGVAVGSGGMGPIAQKLKEMLDRDKH